MADEQNEKTYKERIDPGGELEREAQGLEALASLRSVKWLLKRRGTDPDELLANIQEQRQNIAELTSAPDRIATALSPLGWPYFSSVPHDAYVAAASLVEHGKVEEAEALIADAWNENDVMLGWAAARVFGLYGPDWDFETAMNRQRLLKEAFELHKAEHYAGAISITLAQMEGIFIDMTGKGANAFFEKNNPHLLDDETLPGHSLGLKALAKFMTVGVNKTGASGKLTRHGIFHGRELGYDNRINSTKALTGALALIEWAQPRAVELQEQAAEERNRRYAGSKEVDQWGRRIDQRGFKEAKALLRNVQGRQKTFYLQHQRYATDRKTLDRGGSLKGDFELRTSPNAQAWWAWAVTEPAVVFGLASRDGEFQEREFVAEDPPTGGIGQDNRWRNLYEGDEEYPDWLD